MDRRKFMAVLGIAGAGTLVPSTALAEELEYQMALELNQQGQGQRANQAEQKELPPMPAKPWNPKELPPMPAKPTLADFFKYGRLTTANHCLQSALRALKTGQKDETIFACLIHDLGRDIRTTDHGYWGAQLFEPYVSEKIAWAVKHHQVCRFFPDLSVGYEYPEMYVYLFGKDFEPEPYLKEAYKYARNHKWYMEARVITLMDDYSFQKGMNVDIDMFIDIISRNFKPPKEGLGWDNSPVAHMWRTLINPTRPL